MKPTAKIHILRATGAFTLLACVALLGATSAFAGSSKRGSAQSLQLQKALPPPAAKEFLMSFNEFLTSDKTLDGNVTLTGAISARGTRHEDFTVTGANSDNSQVYLSGTSVITLTDGSGTITTEFTGTIYFDNATFKTTLLAYVEGVESITGGTGAYAGIAGAGHGTFEATLDYTNGNVLGVFEAKVQTR